MPVAVFRTRLIQRGLSRYLWRHPWQLALAVLGIALGVAVVLAVDLANSSARKSFQQASEFLLNSHGRLDVPWGEINRLVRGDKSWAVAGGPDILRAIYGRQDEDTGLLHANAGDTYIAIVDWDADGGLSAESVHQYGSATLDSESAHFADQATLFAEQRFKTVWIETEDILAHSTRRYRPGGDLAE